MIFDKIENLDRYREFAEYGKLIRDFIKQDKSEHLAEGRYKLDGENLFALVQTYETKDKDDAQMESHRKYADLQFMEEGEERIYVDFADELEVEEDRTPNSGHFVLQKSRGSRVQYSYRRNIRILCTAGCTYALHKK